MPGERAGNGDERRDPWAHLRWNVRPFRMCSSSGASDRRRQKRNSFEADEMMSTQPCDDLDPTGRVPRGAHSSRGNEMHSAVAVTPKLRAALNYLGDKLATHRASRFKPSKHSILDEWLYARRSTLGSLRSAPTGSIGLCQSE
jgi:hypothetical protein